ncbi:hypothetical protein LEP1GSC107_4773 [Leptospira interrogans serovar Grippotyphosa str. UI 12769]|nr:hypothetical protein LEP1GSC107_4773 [Leptospira interrogans serovar Grippotyphosa str. UI 12769]
MISKLEFNNKVSIPITVLCEDRMEWIFEEKSWKFTFYISRNLYKMNF